MKRITRATMIEILAEQIPARDADDLPLIRQAINDTSDSYRKDGYEVPDWDQDRMVKSIQTAIFNREVAR